MSGRPGFEAIFEDVMIRLGADLRSDQSPHRSIGGALARIASIVPRALAVILAIPTSQCSRAQGHTER